MDEPWVGCIYKNAQIYNGSFIGYNFCNVLYGICVAFKYKFILKLTTILSCVTPLDHSASCVSDLKKNKFLFSCFKFCRAMQIMYTWAQWILFCWSVLSVFSLYTKEDYVLSNYQTWKLQQRPKSLINKSTIYARQIICLKVYFIILQKCLCNLIWLTMINQFHVVKTAITIYMYYNPVLSTFTGYTYTV